MLKNAYAQAISFVLSLAFLELYETAQNLVTTLLHPPTQTTLDSDKVPITSNEDS